MILGYVVKPRELRSTRGLYELLRFCFFSTKDSSMSYLSDSAFCLVEKFHLLGYEVHFCAAFLFTLINQNLEICKFPVGVHRPEYCVQQGYYIILTQYLYSLQDD